MPKISELPAAGSASDADELAANQAGTSRKLTRAQLLAGTVPSTRIITTGVGLSGGLDFSADRTFNFTIDEMSEVATVDPAADWVAIHDTSAGAVRKTRINTLPSVDINGMTTAAAVDAAADYIAIHDTSAGGVRKTLINTLPTGGEGGGAVAIEDEGNEILAAASRINFSGATVAVSTPAAGEALVTISSSTSSSGGLSGWTDVKLNHGAVGNGSTDDRTAIQNALNSSATTIFFPVGTYRITSGLTVSPGKRLIGSGAGRSIIDGRSFNGDVVTCIGTETTLPNPNASMAESDSRISFASSIDSSLKLGDWIRVVDTTTSSFHTGHSGEKDGFFCMVCSAEGTFMYPYGGVRRTLPSPYAGGPVSNLRAFKLDQRGLSIGDLEVWAAGFDQDSTDNVTVTGHALEVLKVANVFIWNSRFLGAGGNGFQCENCANVHLNNSVFGNHAGQWSGFGAYGIHCNGTGHLYASNCTFLSQRHGFECDNNGMPSHDLVISGGMIATPQEQDFQQPITPFYTALDTHTSCYNIIFRDVHVYGGCDLRSGKTKLLGCTIHGCKDSSNGVIIMLDITEYDFEIRGNTLISYLDRSSGGAVITLEGGSPIPGGLNTHLVISDNIIRQVGSHPAAVMFLRQSQLSADTGQVFITNNLVLNGTTGQDFIDINMASGLQLVVRNNVFPANMDLGAHTGFSQSLVSGNVDGGSAV